MQTSNIHLKAQDSSVFSQVPEAELNKYSKRILIVEDDPELALGLQLQLEHRGYAPEIAKSVCAAKKAIIAEAPELIILDLNLPDGNGLTMLNDLNMHRGIETVPTIIVTAYGFTHNLAWAFPNTVAFFEKPVAFEQLLGPIRKALG